MIIDKLRRNSQIIVIIPNAKKTKWCFFYVATWCDADIKHGVMLMLMRCLQEKAIVGVSCEIGKCTNDTQEAFWVSYGKDMVAKAQALPPQHGAFLTNCPAHCQTGTGGDWGKRSVGGTPLGVAVATWFNQTMSKMAEAEATREGDISIAPRWIATCDEKPCGGDVC
jgi:hypothetical protein